MRLSVKKIIATAVAVIFLFAMSGCDTIKASIGLQKTVVNNESDGKTIETEKKEKMINKDEDSKAKKEINDFLIKLFSNKPDNYISNNETGNIPDAIKEFIAERTYNEGNGNPENGIHLPRIIETNGMNMIEYEVLKYKGEDGKEVPEIDANYLGKNGNTFLYFVKVALKAKCVNESGFSNAYSENSQYHTFTKKSEISESDIDYIKVLFKYDIEVIKEEKGFKILSAREANSKHGFKNRLFRYNNDFIEKLPYLFVDGFTSHKIHQNTEDVKNFEAEKNSVESFLNRLKGIDKNRMDMLRNAWEVGTSEFSSIIGKMTISAEDKLKDKAFKDFFDFNGDYKSSFDISSFPLQLNMKRINQIKKIQVVPHPRYSEKVKMYFVKFDAEIEKVDGAINNSSTYKYDYIFTLSGKGENLKISNLRLNEYSTINKTNQTQNSEQPGNSNEENNQKTSN